MKDPEAPELNKDLKWMTTKDVRFFDGIDKTMEENIKTSEHLDDIAEETPSIENPIKRLKRMNYYYSICSDEEREQYVVDLERLINRQDGSEFDKNVAMTFLTDLRENGFVDEQE
ncbi:MAG: hypothetical protein WCK26_03170 [Candidatus Saccharibacteria bacterium]